MLEENKYDFFYYVWGYCEMDGSIGKNAIIRKYIKGQIIFFYYNTYDYFEAICWDQKWWFSTLATLCHDIHEKIKKYI